MLAFPGFQIFNYNIFRLNPLLFDVHSNNWIILTGNLVHGIPICIWGLTFNLF